MANFSNPGGDYNPYAPPSATADTKPAWTADEEPVLLDASVGSRWWARVIDNVLVGVAAIPLVIPMMERVDRHHEPDPLAIAGFCLIPLAVLVFQWYLIATTGQSLGKRWLKIRAVKVDGSPVGFVHGVLLREWIVFGLGMIPVVGRIVGFLDGAMILGAQRRCMHDLIAGTRVVLALPKI